MPAKRIVKLGDGEGYEGQLNSSNVPEGFGCARFKSGCHYSGTWRDGQFHGVGVLTMPRGDEGANDTYAGEFVGGVEHGCGVLADAAGTYKGEFINGQKSGCGLEVSKSGQRFLGGFRDDQRHGIALIRGRRPQPGQVALERWERGMRTGEGSAVTRDYVGGAAQAAAELAETAFASMAAVADRKAALARQCQSEDENTPPPEQHARWEDSLRANRGGPATHGATEAQAAGAGRRKRLNESKRELENAVQQQHQKEQEKALLDFRLQNQQLKEQVSRLQEDLRVASLARAADAKELVRAQLHASAQMEAQEEHFKALREQYSLEHEKRLERAEKLAEKEIEMLMKEVDYLKNQRDAGASSPAKDALVDATDKKENLAFKVVPLHGKILSESDRKLASPCTLRGPRQMAVFGGALEWGVHAWKLRVEHLGGDYAVDGYIGVANVRNAEDATGFALMCDDNTLGSGKFGSMDSIDGSRSLDDEQVFVLQIDVDRGVMSLKAGDAESRELASRPITTEKPWVPAVMLTSADSSLTLVNKIKVGGEKEKKTATPMEMVTLDWAVRSLKTGAEYTTPEVLHLVQQTELEAASLSDLEHLFLLFKGGQRRVHGAIMSRLASTTVQLRPVGDTCPTDVSSSGKIRTSSSVADTWTHEDVQNLALALTRLQRADLDALPLVDVEHLSVLCKTAHLKLQPMILDHISDM